MGCGNGPGCREILTGPWGYWFGIPVSLVGAITYLGFVVATFVAWSPKRAAAAGAWGTVLVVCSLCLLTAAAWFLFVQAAIIHRFCVVCLVTHGLAASAGLLALVQSAGTNGFAAWRVSWAVPVVFGAAAVIIVGQTQLRPQTHVVREVGKQIISKTAANVTVKNISLFERTFELDLNHCPVAGGRNVPHHVVTLTDFTCYGCRILHGQLMQARQTFSNQFSIVCLPVPLDQSCNSTITEVYPEHTNACQYARLALAVWGANQDLYAKFDEWLFSTPYAPPLDQATDMAGGLIGREQLAAALEAPWIDAQIQTNVQIYKLMFEKIGKHSLPQLIVGKHVAIGTFANPAALHELLLPELSK
jgi:uncharacterized membrane protein